MCRQTSRWTCSSATGRELSAVWPRLRREPGESCWSVLTTAPSAWETPRTDCCCARWRDTPRLCSAWRSVESDVWAATLTLVYCHGSEFHILKPSLCSWMLIPLCFFLSQVVNDLVFSGSSDQCVYAHNIHVSYLFISLQRLRIWCYRSTCLLQFSLLYWK